MQNNRTIIEMPPSNSNENMDLISKFENMVLKTENQTLNSRDILFRDKSLLLEQTNNLKLKCKFMKNDELQKMNALPKKPRSKSTHPHINCEISDDTNISFCEKSHRTEISSTNLETSKFSNINNAKNPLKLSNISSFLNQNDRTENIDNDLSTTIPHSFYEKDKESGKKQTVKGKNNEFYETKIQKLEEKVNGLRMELVRKENEIKILKNGLVSTSEVDYNEVFNDAKTKKIGFKKLQNDFKAAKRSYESKIKSQENKYQKLHEIYIKQQSEIETFSFIVQEICQVLNRNEKEFDKLQQNNLILLNNFKKNENIKRKICESYDDFKSNIEEKLQYYSSKLQKLNENERIIEQISLENRELKAQKSFLMQKIKLI